MAKPLLSLVMVANTALAVAMQKREPFDAAEVWVDSDAGYFHIRFFDQRLPNRFPQSPGNWARAYHEGLKVDGSDRNAQFPVSLLKLTVTELKREIIRAFGFSPAGRPREWDRHELHEQLMEYVSKTDIPILAEFAYKTGITREQLYAMEELSDAIKACLTKKEVALESKALANNVNCTMAIFSLKQMGWKDTHDHTLGGDKQRPIHISKTDAEL